MKNRTVLLLDAGTGNLQSVHNTLRTLGSKVSITSDPEQLLFADRVILPGVGAFAKFMEGLKDRNLIDAIHQFIATGKPLLGICVGMQAFFETSEEMGSTNGLSVFPGKVIQFSQELPIKIPHTGWNQLWFEKSDPLLSGIDSGAYAYFNHSFYCRPAENKQIVTNTDYGLDFCSIVNLRNVYGVQFHPEKSQQVGMRILQNFLNL